MFQRQKAHNEFDSIIEINRIASLDKNGRKLKLKAPPPRQPFRGKRNIVFVAPDVIAFDEHK